MGSAAARKGLGEISRSLPQGRQAAHGGSYPAYGRAGTPRLPEPGGNYPDTEGPTGVLHAKAVLADNRWVFITSANLTAAAWDQNIELGLLTEDPPLAAQITRHFETLIARQLLVRLP